MRVAVVREANIGIIGNGNTPPSECFGMVFFFFDINSQLPPI